jgi:hypothetical protein
MEDVRELIRRYGLEEDQEHVIIPVSGKDGHTRRIFLLKRRFMRIVYPEGQYVDYPLAEAVEATVRYPDLLLSEALYLMHKESGMEDTGVRVNMDAAPEEAEQEKDVHSALTERESE